ncbi:MAG: hypothetical protein RLZ12_858 [Bacillota bacterium]|jgi:hypothetical protein
MPGSQLITLLLTTLLQTFIQTPSPANLQSLSLIFNLLNKVSPVPPQEYTIEHPPPSPFLPPKELQATVFETLYTRLTNFFTNPYHTAHWDNVITIDAALPLSGLTDCRANIIKIKDIGDIPTMLLTLVFELTNLTNCERIEKIREKKYFCALTPFGYVSQVAAIEQEAYRNKAIIANTLGIPIPICENLYKSLLFCEATGGLLSTTFYLPQYQKLLQKVCSIKKDLGTITDEFLNEALPIFSEYYFRPLVIDNLFERITTDVTQKYSKEAIIQANKVGLDMAIEKNISTFRERLLTEIRSLLQ